MTGLILPFRLPPERPLPRCQVCGDHGSVLYPLLCPFHLAGYARGTSRTRI